MPDLSDIGAAFFITNRGSGYYNLGEPLLLQIRAELLQNGTDITNHASLSQIKAIIINQCTVNTFY